AGFTTPIGLFELDVIPFGMKKSPAEFQRAMDSCFAVEANAVCYIDDIVICGQDFDSVVQRVKLQCMNTGFYLRLGRSEWFKDEVKSLGHVIGQTGIKVQASTSWRQS
ncbi:polyprotein, partial [Gregarina niphandrodes]